VNDAKPLKILFVWHHHQPYYKADGKFLLPWVRMHGIKDYWDMVRILDDYQNIRQTFNFTPSLLEQLQEYLDHETTDAAYDLSLRNPDSFTMEDKIRALKVFFLANTERMIRRYRRYSELLDKWMKKGRDDSSAVQSFSSQDFRDLQVWWNLSWVGEYSRFDPPFRYYLDKERNFTEEEKLHLLRSQLDILRRIVPHHIEAANRGQIEISASPFYHPILPLLCDSNSGREANPETRLPANRFRHPEDADEQVKSGLKYAETIFGVRPKGMWPSEGSVSDAALNIMVKNKIAWTATDELILKKTLLKSRKKTGAEFLEKYFAYYFGSGKNRIKIFFRDHDLSDLIGFVYSRWSPDDAASDFVGRLLGIRDLVRKRFGENALDYAVVPIILDGENAWEFYQSDGKDFLRTLYYRLSNETRIETALPSDIEVRRGNILKHISPGSWINGDFKIWIGHPEDNKAWDFLFHARDAFEKLSKGKQSVEIKSSHKELMIAEGSDWCWWYGDEHKSPQAGQFDELFRYHLKQVHKSLGMEAPAELEEPIKKKTAQLLRQPSSKISPRFEKRDLDKEWKNAGIVEQASGAMQKEGTLIKRVYWGNDLTNIYLRIDTTKKISSEKIVIRFLSDPQVYVELGRVFSFRTECPANDFEFSGQCRIDDTIQVALNLGKIKFDDLNLTIALYNNDVLIDSFPHDGTARFGIVQ